MGAKLSLASKGVPQPSLGTKKRVGLATLFIVMHSILSDNHQIKTILNLQTDSLRQALQPAASKASEGIKFRNLTL